MKPRTRIYDAQALAVDMVERFNDRPWEYQENFGFSWPNNLQNIGDSLAVAYASDKWKPRNKKGKKEQELYKHIAESRNRIFVKPGLLCDLTDPEKSWPVVGPMVSFESCPMPEHFAILGLFEEASLKLYKRDGNGDPVLSSDENEDIVKITVRHGMLGASKILWSKLDEREQDEPFLLVYTKTSGILAIIVGENLHIEKDGIAG